MIDISNIDTGSNPAFSAISQSVHFRGNPRNTLEQFFYKQFTFRNSPK